MTALTGLDREGKLALARRFERGKISKSKFCLAEGISEGSLDHWRRALRDERPGQGFIEASFIEVDASGGNLLAAKTSQADIEVELPFGVKLRFFGVKP